MKPGVLITGASGDLGRALARRFREDGWDVRGTLHRQDPGGSPLATPLDIRDPDSIGAVLTAWAEETGNPCCLIHAAGSPRTGMLATQAAPEWRGVLEEHAASALAVARAAARIFIPRHSGHLLFLSSLAAVRPNPGQAAYAAGKGAVESLVRALAREWGPKRIRVNAIAPGYIESAAVRHIPEETRRRLLDAVPLQRAGHPGEVAALASFLSSPQAGYITGQVLRIDGGASI